MTQQNEITLVPVNQDGERLELNPSIVKDLDNIELTQLFAQLKSLDSLKKKAEEEVKKRLDEGQQFNRLSYGKQATTKELTMTNQQKFDLVTAHGWDCVVPLSLPQLKKLLGDNIEQELEQMIVLKPKKAPLVWDK